MSEPSTVPVTPDGKLHRRLTSFGVLLLTLSCLSPVLSIYGVGSDVLTHAGSGAAGLFLLGIAAAVIWAVVYAEVGSAYPYAGGDYVGVGSILGAWAGFLSLATWTVTAGPSIAFEAKIMATYVGDLAPSIPPAAVTFGTLAGAVLLACLAVRTSAIVTGLFLAVEMLAVLALFVAGLLHPVRGLGEVLSHPMALNAAGLLAPVGFIALALGGVSAAYGTAGGNQAISFGEELQDPHRHMGRVVVLSGVLGALTIGLPVIAVVLGAGDLHALLTSASPFNSFMSSVAGPGAARALSAGVALAIFNAMIAQIMVLGRLFFSLGRDGVLHPKIDAFLARVHLPSGAPRMGTLALGAYAAACCMLSSHLLLIFGSGIVVSSLTLVSLAVLIGRRKGLTGAAGYWRSPLYPLAPVLGLGLAAVFVVADLADADAGRPSILILAAVMAAAALWYHQVLKRRPGGWAPRLD